MYASFKNSPRQVGAAKNGQCDVLVEWEYGEQLPDLVEVYFSDSCNHDGPRVGIKIRDPKETKGDSLTVRLNAPTIGVLLVCPRLLDGPGPRPEMPDEDGENQPWTDFCDCVDVRTKGTETKTGKEGCKPIPSIVSTRMIEGGIEIWWDKNEPYDRYELFWRRGNKPERKVDVEGNYYLLERTEAGHTYSVRVRGCHDPVLGVLGGCCSEPSPVVTISVPQGMGYVVPKFGQDASLQAISRSPDHMDVFAVGSDGQLRSAWWDGQWHMWFRIGDPILAPGAPVATLVRDDDFMDLFAVAKDGQVHVAWWNGNPWRGWAAIGDGLFPPGSPVGAISRHSDFMDIFVVGFDGRVYQSSWHGNPWQPWRPIGAEVFSPGTPIAALARNEDHMEIFAVGLDGIVRGNWWDGQWHDWYRLDGALFPQRAHIGVIRRDDDHMDIYAVAEDGVLYSNWWDGDWQGWFTLDGEVFEPGAPLAAQARHAGHMEVLAMNLDRRMVGTWWDGRWQGWFLLTGTPPSDMEFYPPITAVTRNDMQLDVFAILVMEEEEFVFSNWWHGSWKRWFMVS
jgi:hypothetical protein